MFYGEELWSLTTTSKKSAEITKKTIMLNISTDLRVKKVKVVGRAAVELPAE